jgi:hypothetical protein
VREELGLIKGAAFLEFVAWWEQVHEEGDVQRVLEELSSGEAAPFVVQSGRALGLRSEAWYPAGVVHHIIDRLLVGFTPEQQGSAAVEAAQAIIEASLRGAMGVVVKMLGSPARYPWFAQRMWNMHYDTGEIWVDQRGPWEHVIRRRAWKGHHPFICRVTKAAAVPIYEALGCSEVEFEPRACVSDGDPQCENVVRWF